MKNLKYALDSLLEGATMGLRSRKFILAVSSAVAAALGAPVEVVAPLVGYILVEGVADIKSR